MKNLGQMTSSYVSQSFAKHGSSTICEFRLVDVALGLYEDRWPPIRSELVRETLSHDVKTKHGIDIASAYNRVVISLANGGNVGGCTTTFPLWSSPPQSEPHETIVIAHVYGNHFIKAALREGCPPITHPLWRTYRSDIASRWEDPYVSRQKEFREHYYSIPEFFDISK
ncbi:hypothetical protein Tco_1219391 [Tanacetum coccineum]